MGKVVVKRWPILRYLSPEKLCHFWAHHVIRRFMYETPYMEQDNKWLILFMIKMVNYLISWFVITYTYIHKWQHYPMIGSQPALPKIQIRPEAQLLFRFAKNPVFLQCSRELQRYNAASKSSWPWTGICMWWIYIHPYIHPYIHIYTKVGKKSYLGHGPARVQHLLNPVFATAKLFCTS